MFFKKIAPDFPDGVASVLDIGAHAGLFSVAARIRFPEAEIHAYEPVRLGMILEMLSHLTHDLGAACLVMSATLPSMLMPEPPPAPFP